MSRHPLLQMLSRQIENRLIIVHKVFVYIGNDRGNMCKGELSATAEMPINQTLVWCRCQQVTSNDVWRKIEKAISPCLLHSHLFLSRLAAEKARENTRH